MPPRLYGGIERIVDGIATELRLRKHRVGLIAHPESTCAVDSFFPWPSDPANPHGNTLRHARALSRAVNTFQPDVVHSFSRLGFLLPLLRRRIGKVMSYQRHTGGAKLAVMAALGGRRFRYTGCSEYIAAMGRRAGGEWHAIPNFVDTSFYRFTPAVPADAPLVFLSRVERIKGAHTAVAIARAARRRLIIAGNQPDTDEGRTYWRTEIQPALQPGVVDYVGPVNDDQKNQLLGGAAAMLVPIEWDEPFGIVFAEALACGTPVISCPRGALPEIVVPGEHGFLIRTVEEGVKAVQGIGGIARAACRTRAESRFSRAAVVSQYESLYREVALGTV